ncbi:MAG: lysophospholipid acyltransferase family protein [Spirochaetia bacterium]|jgi:1-acyl-sn-glycerol-3-phosphate acyltransferase
MKRERAPRPSGLIVPLMRLVVLPFLIRRYRVSASGGLRALRALPPPYIVLANHVNYWDPFWISAFIRHPVQFVTSDNIFREAFFGAAMRLVGSIPKTKLMNDSRTVRQIFGVRGNKGVIGIFPEGSRSYDGRSGPVIPAVARLIRKLGIPVISATIAGGYLSRPRWARHVRRGRVQIQYRLLFSKDDLARLSDDEVSEAVAQAIDFNEMDWQRKSLVRFRGRRPAEFLERLLFICPHCRSVSRLESRADRLTCMACGYQVRMNRLGFFEPRRGPLYFEDPAKWNAWQLPVLQGMLAETGRPGQPIFEERPTLLLRGYRDRPLRVVSHGSAALMRDRILFYPNAGGPRSFFHSKIRGMNVQNGEKLEFYYDNALFRLDFRSARASPYKWTKTVEILAGTDPQARSLIRVNTY